MNFDNRLRRHTKFLCGTLFVICIAAVEANAATWFVANSGNDSVSCALAQSSATPKRTIASALACVGRAGTEDGAGDTVQVAAGSYSDSGNANLVDVIPSGSSEGLRFVLKCETDFACAINISTGNWSFGFNAASHYITIQGFVWTGGKGGYMSSNTDNTFHHISLINNEYRDSPHCFGCLVSGGGAADILIKGNRIHNVGSDRSCVGYCHGIYPSSHTQRWTIEDNQFYNTHGYGIHVYSEDPVFLNRPQNFVIRRNLTYGNGVVGSNGAGIIVYGGGHQVYNNLTYANAYYGIMVRSAETKLYNNTVHNNPSGGIYSEDGSLSCVNNLVIGNGGPQIEGCGTNTSNITTGSVTSFFENAAAGNYSLVPGSGAIDRGTSAFSVSDDYSGRPRPQGAGYDVGAYEYGDSPSSPPAPPANLRVLP